MRHFSIHPTTAVYHTKHLSMHPTTTEHLTGGMEYTTKVYIPKIPRQTTSTNLTKLFSGLFPKQKIVDVNIKTRHEEKYAFVNFENEVLLPIERRVDCPWTDDAWLVLKAATSRRRSTTQSNSNKANDKNSTNRRQVEKSTPSSKIEMINDTNNKFNKSKSSANDGSKNKRNDKNLSKTNKSEDASETVNKLTEEVEESTEYSNSSTSKANDGRSNKIYIRNLPRNTTRDQVARLFSETYPDANLYGIFISPNSGARKFGFLFVSSEDDMGIVLGDSSVTKVPCPWAKDVTLEFMASKKHPKNIDNGSNDVAMEIKKEEESQTNAGNVINKPIEEDHGSSAAGAAKKSVTSEASPDTQRSKESSSPALDISAELAATKLLLEKATCESSKIRAELELARKQLIPGTKAIEEVKVLQNELKATKTKLKEMKVLQNELRVTKTKLKESQSEISILNEDLFTTRKDLESLRSDLAISELMNSANSTTFDSFHSTGGFNLNLGIEAALSSGSGMGMDDQNKEDMSGSSPEKYTTMSAETEDPVAEDERRSAEKCEVEFVLLRSLFTPEELWISTSPSSNLPTIHRRLLFPIGSGIQPVPVELKLIVPVGYSVYSSAVLGAVATLANSNTEVDGKVQKCIIGSFPRLLAACQREAEIHAGEDAIFFVMQSADAWLTNDWKDIFENEMQHIH